MGVETHEFDEDQPVRLLRLAPVKLRAVDKTRLNNGKGKRRYYFEMIDNAGVRYGQGVSVSELVSLGVVVFDCELVVRNFFEC